MADSSVLKFGVILIKTFHSVPGDTLIWSQAFPFVALVPVCLLSRLLLTLRSLGIALSSCLLHPAMMTSFCPLHWACVHFRDPYKSAVPGHSLHVPLQGASLYYPHSCFLTALVSHRPDGCRKSCLWLCFHSLPGFVLLSSCQHQPVLVIKWCYSKTP